VPRHQHLIKLRDGRRLLLDEVLQVFDPFHLVIP
jgi:hypothetical protein